MNINQSNNQNQTKETLNQILSNILSIDVALRTQSETQINLLASENLSQFLISISEKISTFKRVENGG